MEFLSSNLQRFSGNECPLKVPLRGPLRVLFSVPLGVPARVLLRVPLSVPLQVLLRLPPIRVLLRVPVRGSLRGLCGL